MMITATKITTKWIELTLSSNINMNTHLNYSHTCILPT